MKKVLGFLMVMFLVNAPLCAEQMTLTEVQKQSPEWLAMKKNTPLIAALYEKAPESEIRKIIKAGANPNTEQDQYGKRPLQVAVRLENIGAVQALIEGGADVNQLEKGSTPPLEIAVVKGNVPLAQMLIKKGADIQYLDSISKNTLLHTALASGNTSMITFLLSKGLDINAKNAQGITPLVTAVFLGEHPDVVKLLLSRGAEYDAEQLIDLAKREVSLAEKNKNEKWANFKEKQEILSLVEKAVQQKK